MAMKAAIVRGPGQTPVYGDFSEPAGSEGECLVSVTASAMSCLAKGRASGTHYSASSDFPFVAGFDGVGRLGDGRRVYFIMPSVPFGAMAERTVVPAARCLALPADLDDVTAAAIANPGMSSWAALTERARLEAGETVLVNGATGASGRLAVQIAKRLGASKVIATGRNVKVLDEVASLGADATIPLVEDDSALASAFGEQFAAGVDVVVDYLWGRSAELLLAAGATAGRNVKPIRFVQVGSIGGVDITLPSAILRSSTIELMGSGLGSVPFDRLVRAIDALFQATVPGGFQIAAKPVPLSEVEQAWRHDDSASRTVFIVGSFEHRS